MSAQDRYTKIIESLVNGEEATASELLHEAIVDKAREIWSDLVEQDDIAEDEISEEDLDEAFGGVEEEDFLDDIETADDSIESEEAFEADEDEEEMDMDDMEMDSDMEELAGDEEGDEGHGDIEDAMVNVEDALADLKAEFAKIMGDDAEESEDEVEEEFAFESEEELEESEDEELEEATDEDEETLEEGADLSKVGKDGAIHPIDMPAGDDGKASPVAGKNDMGGETIKTGAKGSEGSKKGLSDETAKDMGVTHPGDGAKLSPESRGHGAEKKGKGE